jgi:hypothetical protein
MRLESSIVKVVVCQILSHTDVGVVRRAKLAIILCKKDNQRYDDDQRAEGKGYFDKELFFYPLNPKPWLLLVRDEVPLSIIDNNESDRPENIWYNCQRFENS